MMETNLKDKIVKEFDENVNSHVFLVSTNDKEESFKEIKEAVKHIVDADEIVKSQIENELYLEMIIISPDGKEIKKDQILELQERLKIQPVLSKYLVYVVKDAETLNESSSNKLLKTIEEPFENVIGFLITSDINLLLPTIQSRCEIINQNYDREAVLGEPSELEKVAIKLIDAIEKDDLLEFNIIKNTNKFEKEESKEIANYLKDYYNTACGLTEKSNYDKETIEKIKSLNSRKTLVKKAEYLNSVLNKLVSNMNSDLMLEKLFIDLKEVKQKWSTVV